MVAYDSGTPTAAYAPPTWTHVLLGVVLMLGGLFVLGDIALATLISTLFLGFTAIIVGPFEIAHAFMTRGWGALPWRVALGSLYIAFGMMVVNQPASGALIVTFAIGMAFFVLGVVRIVVAIGHWREAGWLMLFQERSASWPASSSSPDGRRAASGSSAFSSESISFLMALSG